MAIEMSISSSQGRAAEWHDTILSDGRRKTTTPKNADTALRYLNEHWHGDVCTSDGTKFDEIFADDIEKYNAKQTRADRKIGPESSRPERQKSYYDGIVDGTYCFGKGKQKETPIYEIVLQIGNKDDNGITDADFDLKRWKQLKKSGKEDEASKYALEHVTKDPYAERTKRILHRAVDRIAAMDPDHLRVIRADFHGDEPCGTGNVHVAFVLRATGYKTGMESRAASVKALEQMGFKKQRDTQYGIVQLHERFKDIIEEEMQKDAMECGYEPIKRKEPTGEHRKRSDVDAFREMAEQQEELFWEGVRQTLDQEKLDRRKKELDQKDAGLKKREEKADLKEKMADAKTADACQMYSLILSKLTGTEQTEEYMTIDEIQQATAKAFQVWEDSLQEQKDALMEATQSAEKINQEAAEALYAYTQAKEAFHSAARELAPEKTVADWMKRRIVYVKGATGKAEKHTVMDLWETYQRSRRTETKIFQTAEELSKRADMEAGKTIGISGASMKE